MISQDKLRAAIHSIIQRHSLSYEDFGESIGISKMMVSYILSGKRNLALKKIETMCEVWGVDFNTLFEEEKQAGQNISDMINEILRIKKLQIDELAEMTGIDVLTLSHIKRGLKKPSKEELDELIEIFGVEFAVVDEGTVTSAFQIIREQLERIQIPEEGIDAVMRYLERELQSRRYVK